MRYLAFRSWRVTPGERRRDDSHKPIVMLFADVDNLREVVVFPFNQQAQDLMMNAGGRSDGKATEGAPYPHRGAVKGLGAPR